MKKIIFKSLMAVAIAGGLVSCSDFLDQKSPSSMDGHNVFSSLEFADGTICNIYTQYQEQNYRARSIWYGYNTDVEFYLSSKNGDGKANLATYAADPANDQLNSNSGTLWGHIYSAIERANLAIEGLRENADIEHNPQMANLLGEALTLRALHYIDLINMWGDVPARFESMNSSNMYPARVDRDIIYKQLIADLQEATKLSAWPKELDATMTVERVNKAFVYGLLARVCLQASGYAQRADGQNRLSTDPELSKEKLYPIALEACRALMAEEVKGEHVSLKPSFEDIFNNNGISGDVITAGDESLFEIGYANGDNGKSCRGRIMYTFGIKHNSEDDITTMKQGSQVGPVPTLYFDYSVKDLRRDVTCVPYQWNKGKQELQSSAKWSFGKLRYEWTNRFIKSGNDDGINKCYMRYADVVLMRAEIENELNGPEAAKPFLQKVRNRAFAVNDRQENVTNYLAKITTKEQMFNAIVNERALEFAGEFIRKADLIRWGLLKTKMDEAKDKMTALANLVDYDAEHPYSQINPNLYYKLGTFTWTCDGVTKSLGGAKLSLYGINYGELDIDPEGYESYVDSKGNPTKWIKDTSFDDIIPYLYTKDPDKRQYWPFFNLNITDNVNLVNYEWY